MLWSNGLRRDFVAVMTTTLSGKDIRDLIAAVHRLSIGIIDDEPAPGTM
jgi:hypothetical protein